MPLHVSSTCAHHQEFKIVLYSIWYHHTDRATGSTVHLNNYAKYVSLLNAASEYALLCNSLKTLENNGGGEIIFSVVTYSICF